MRLVVASGREDGFVVLVELPNSILKYV